MSRRQLPGLGEMKRRTFCRNSIATGVGASLYASGASALLDVVSDVVAVTSSGDSISIEKAAVSELASSLAGPLILPDDERYESTRKVWNGMIDRRPAMIALCTNANDVANAVTFAAERNLLVAVKGGGHSYPGKSSCDQGIVIDLSNMRDVTVNAEASTMSAGGGALLSQLDTEAISRNMITTTGVVSHTGIGGFSLGGGMGRVNRKFGLSVDNVLAATLVTADGKIRRVSADDNPDLYWAIRGGGGNFGVATEFQYRIHPFDPNPLAGSLTYSFDQAKSVLRNLAEHFETMPDECNIEPGFGVSAEGDRFIYVGVCYAGDYATGEKIIAPLRAIGKPSSDTVTAMSFLTLQTSVDGYFAHGRQNYLKSGFIKTLTPAAIDAMVDNYEGDFLPDTWIEHLGGAVSRVEATATAFSHRDSIMNYGISSVWDDPAESEQRIAKIREYYAAIEPHMSGFYTNLNEDTEQKTWSNYGVNLPRLVEAKNKYDPGNLFHLNSNIQPSL
jgi:FAD/FMN-containing dehydrogenase